MERVVEPYDPNYWKRAKAAKELGISIEETAEEPDNDPASPEQAGWDKFKEDEWNG